MGFELKRLENIQQTVVSNITSKKNEINKKESDVNKIYKSISFSSWVGSFLPSKLYADKILGFLIGASALDVTNYRRVCQEIKVAKSQLQSLESNKTDVERQIKHTKKIVAIESELSGLKKIKSEASQAMFNANKELNSTYNNLPLAGRALYYIPTTLLRRNSGYTLGFNKKDLEPVEECVSKYHTIQTNKTVATDAEKQIEAKCDSFFKVLVKKMSSTSIYKSDEFHLKGALEAYAKADQIEKGCDRGLVLISNFKKAEKKADTAVVKLNKKSSARSIKESESLKRLAASARIEAQDCTRKILSSCRELKDNIVSLGSKTGKGINADSLQKEIDRLQKKYYLLTVGGEDYDSVAFENLVIPSSFTSIKNESAKLKKRLTEVVEDLFSLEHKLYQDSPGGQTANAEEDKSNISMLLDHWVKKTASA